MVAVVRARPVLEVVGGVIAVGIHRSRELSRGIRCLVNRVRRRAGALAAVPVVPVVPGVFEIKAVRCACAPLPVVPEGDELPLGVVVLVGELLLGLSELGELLPPTPVVTVSDELAGHPSCSSCVSWDLAAFSAFSSVLTVACAESSVEALVGVAVSSRRRALSRLRTPWSRLPAPSPGPG